MNNTIENLHRERPYPFFLRAIEKAQKMNMYILATFENTSIFVYPESCHMDLLQKLDLQKIVDSV